MSVINRFSVLAVLAFSELACSGSKSETRAATPATETPAPAGDLVRGGQLYDTWWKVAGVKDTTPPAGNNPDYARTTGTQQGPATWRCKECHGWDYRGRDGAYQSGIRHGGDGRRAGAPRHVGAETRLDVHGDLKRARFRGGQVRRRRRQHNATRRCHEDSARGGPARIGDRRGADDRGARHYAGHDARRVHDRDGWFA